MQKYEHAFGKNDIRGIYKDDITEELFFNIGRSFPLWLKDKTKKSDLCITVCRDARLHSPQLSDALISGLINSNVKVIDLGLAPTPLGYFSDVTIDGVDSAMIITASHNPKEYNGLKMTYNHQTLNEQQIKEVKEITFNNWTEFNKTDIKNVEKFDIVQDYITNMKERFGQIGKGVKVVVDSANATGGIVGPELYKQLGCDVIELYSEPDGNFPNHHPNPSDLKTLKDLETKVIESGADVGIAFDGDSDRIGVVDTVGRPMTGDKLLLIYALDIIESGIKPTVVSEVKCSQVLYDTINRLGGNAVMTKTGHGYIKEKMKEVNAILAGEMSGHTFFKDRYYGYDDAIYAGCRIIEIIAKNKANNNNFKIQDMLKDFDAVYTSDEVRYPCPNELKKPVLTELKDYVNSNRDMFGVEIKDIITLDGMRIVFDGGFALIRQSNTEPVFTLRFEAKTQAVCESIQKIMLDNLDSILENAKNVMHISL